MADTTFLASQVKMLVETVVNNRDPSARAGCALSFGAIHNYVGGLAVGALIVGIRYIRLVLQRQRHRFC